MAFMLAPSRYTSPPASWTILRDLLDPRLEQPQRVGIGNHEHGRLVVELGGQIVDIDKALGRALDGHDRGSRPSPRWPGSVPWAASGISTTERLLAEVAEIGRGHQQGRHLAVRPGGRLERDGRQPGDLGQHVLRLVQQGQHALQRRFGLVGVQVGHARQRRQPLVPLGVVLHRTGAQRIEVGIDRHVSWSRD